MSLAYAYLASSSSSGHDVTTLRPSQSSHGSADKPKSLHKAQSTGNLDAMIAANRAADDHQDDSFQTLSDPRHASNSDLSRTSSVSPKPNGDASDELSVLNDKLIRAIEHSNSLEEKVTQTRQELEASRARIAQLEAEANQWAQVKAAYLSPDEAEQLRKKAQAELDEERKQKAVVLQEKRGIESELETLTASLFDEANKMVAAANEQRSLVEKKNQQLRDQIKDGEALIASQTEQLTELKTLMMQIKVDARPDIDSPRESLAPSSPDERRGGDNDLARLLEAMNLSPVSAEHGQIPPSPATSLTHLVRPSCRTDVPAYDDFKSLLAAVNLPSHNPSHTPSRAGSGSYAGMATGLGLMPNNSTPNLVGNLPKLSSDSPTPKSSQTPASHLPGQFSPSTDQKSSASVKDNRFYKRLVVEDIEPTLRLDLSPTISWLNRRAILSALADSTLLVEPIPEASQKLYGMYTPCAMCGESRKSGQNPRTHAMRVHEGESATKWSVCVLCLEKVRAVCDLIAYIKMIREGIVKCADRKDEEEIWEELVRMRERLFWARMAGGVIPSFLPSVKNSPAPNADHHSTIAPSHSSSNRHQTRKINSKYTDASQTPADTAGETDAHYNCQSNNDDDDQNQDTQSEREAREQLERSLADATTFDNAREKIRLSAAAASSPIQSPQSANSTPPRGRANTKGSGSRFPTITIPKLPDGFWAGTVNTLH